MFINNLVVLTNVYNKLNASKSNILVFLLMKEVIKR